MSRRNAGILLEQSSGRWLLGSALLAFGLFFAWAPHFFGAEGPRVVFFAFAAFGIGFGVAYLTQRSSIAFDPASALVEQATTVFGMRRSIRMPLARFDRVSLEPSQNGPFSERVLLLRGPDGASLRLGSALEDRDWLFSAGVAAALATGLPFDESQENGAVTRLSPAQLAELASEPVDAELPWWRRPSAVALVLANLVPLAGVLLGGWQVLPLMLLFWLENVIIGGFTIAKMLLAKESAVLPYRIFLGAFFAFHYGAFAVGHGTILLEIFGDHGGRFSGGMFVTELPRLVWYVLGQHGLWWGALALLASHAVTFHTEYLGPRRQERQNPAQLLFAPYKRVVILHLVLILGAALVQGLGSTFLPLALLVLVKIAIDLGGHLREHRTIASRT